MRARPVVLMASLAWILCACRAAQAVPLTPEGQAVEVDKLSPSGSARNLGPVDVSHGGGCGAFAVKGTYEGAVAELRNRAAELGGNFAQIQTVTEPHDDSGCTTGGYAIRGIVFFVSHAPPPPVEAPEPPRPGVCDPPCSPGFACHEGACIPVCNPPCEASEVCTRRRTCEPKAGPVDAGVAVEAGPAVDARAE
jgi:hypothetical protein